MGSLGFQGSASVNPARAGMIPPSAPILTGDPSKPRASGDDPARAEICGESMA